MDIAPGTTVCVEIATTPRNAAACKTLTRVCRKDPAIVLIERRQRTHRPTVRTWQRGGRMWQHRMKTRAPVELAPGAKYTVRATVDVLRDLASVERWIKVSPA